MEKKDRMDAQSLRCRNGDGHRKFKKLAFIIVKSGKFKFYSLGLEARDPRKSQFCNLN